MRLQGVVQPLELCSACFGRSDDAASRVAGIEPALDETGGLEATEHARDGVLGEPQRLGDGARPEVAQGRVLQDQELGQVERAFRREDRLQVTRRVPGAVEETPGERSIRHIHIASIAYCNNREKCKEGTKGRRVR